MKFKGDLKTFKKVIEEAAELFNKPAYSITIDQFRYAARGRVSDAFYRIYGYANLKKAVAPSPDMSKSSHNEARQMIERLLKNA